MTRQPHDQFAKQYLEELLSPLGTVEISREVPGEARQIDLWFAPAPQPATDPQTLGLLGQIASTPCQIEPFRNQPSKTEIRNCLLKLFSLHGQMQRQARREDEPLSETELPRLWILTSSASTALLDSFGAKIDPNHHWPQGVYFTPEGYKTSLIAINQLPETTETLWLRLLGKGATQAQAINELIALPSANPLRLNVLELLSVWRINIENKETLTEDEQELIMQLSPAYLQWREDTLREGRQEGRQEGVRAERRTTIENLLKLRFGTVDAELSSIIESMLEIPTEELLQFLLQSSRQELLARFGGGQQN